VNYENKNISFYIKTKRFTGNANKLMNTNKKTEGPLLLLQFKHFKLGKCN